MLSGLVLMGISQSLITLGGHTYMIKAINEDLNDMGENDSYPFSVMSIQTLGRLKNEGQFIGSVAVSVCMTSYWKYKNEGTNLNILDISYRL